MSTWIFFLQNTTLINRKYNEIVFFVIISHVKMKGMRLHRESENDEELV
jgi:hypothetical protein